MDSTLFDRITKALASFGPRRDAMKALAASGLAIATANLRGGVAPAHRKKRCRKRNESCGGKKKCCSKKDKCGASTDTTCELTGSYCCGKEGAPCNKTVANNGGACECCAGFHCSGALPFRHSKCVSEGT
jgi:hypothetical protein